ncbi:DUF2293 domain-containing protein [Streptomyces sp. WI04-05B]|uniref:DUF2293 domain-containing protein n=1 Tax=Streptomyces TaxID=1883 RepID=UPI0029AF366F|nr:MULTISPECIES: DUF2293 domain-containing protein [unclassified Streptomyces]MDX2541207.1 DUF2293 domain-containing protein [Streptomyces sp. WI04-05B]MDX2585563.1 DUF2293 domain-containing protein [Streptomyces sp. WI04-05A]MDX3751297.1 DUF2293 domain-containing protein [Streptomyces sp. AK08-02]
MDSRATPPLRAALLVVQPLRRRHCAECRRGPLALLVPEDRAPRCLDCADLGHLVFLPRGDTALTRRSREESGLWAVVVRFNRRKGRYERQGVLVEEAGLARAEVRCLADAEARRRRRVRDARRRDAADLRFAEAFAREILRLFPGCPTDRAEAVAAHASVRGSGRVGRSAAGRALSEGAVVSAVVASVRHVDTPYDALLMSGVARHEARRRTTGAVEARLREWRTETGTSAGAGARDGAGAEPE